MRDQSCSARWILCEDGLWGLYMGGRFVCWSVNEGSCSGGQGKQCPFRSRAAGLTALPSRCPCDVAAEPVASGLKSRSPCSTEKLLLEVDVQRLDHQMVLPASQQRGFIVLKLVNSTQDKISKHTQSENRAFIVNCIPHIL